MSETVLTICLLNERLSATAVHRDEVAGDPRRFKDSSERLAVVACADGPKPLLDEFERLPQIVTVLERADDRAMGVTVEGVPVELVVAVPKRFGTELVRATGSPECARWE